MTTTQKDGLYMEDLPVGEILRGPHMQDGMTLPSDEFDELFGLGRGQGIFARAAGSVDPLLAFARAFCCTTAASQNSPASLQTDGLIFRSPPIIDGGVSTAVLGHKFRGEDATNGKVQLASWVGPREGKGALETAPMAWTRQVVVPFFEGTAGKAFGENLNTLVSPPNWDYTSVAIPTLEELSAQPHDRALSAEEFVRGQRLMGRSLVLDPELVLSTTKGLGNLAEIHYDQERGFLVWGVLTYLLAAKPLAVLFQSSILLGIRKGTHTARVYLTEKYREGGVPDNLFSTLTPGEQLPIPGRDDVRLVPVQMDIWNHMGTKGREMHERFTPEGVREKVLANISENNGMHLVGTCELMLAVFTNAALKRRR